MNNQSSKKISSVISLQRGIIWLVLFLLSGFAFLVPAAGIEAESTSPVDLPIDYQPDIRESILVSTATVPTVTPGTAAETVKTAEDGITIDQPVKSSVIPGFQPAAEDDTTICFGQMGIDAISMSGPVSMTDIAFRTPLSWNIIGNAVLNLNYELKQMTDNRNREGEVLPYLTFSVNGTEFQTSVLEEGENQNLEITIPQDILVSKTHYYTLELKLFADWDCEHSGVTEITISPESSIQFSYEKQPLLTTLADFPRPFYLSNSFVQIPSYLIIPDHSTEEELSLILDFVGTFGKLASRTFSLKLLRFSDITDGVLQNGNLLFVGTANSFPGLEAVQFPVSYSNGAFISEQTADNQVINLQEDDGLLQTAASPWNEYRMVMYIGGQTESGLAKAVSSLSVNLNRYLIQNTLAVISESPKDGNNSIGYDQPVTIKDLTKSENIDLQGIGTLNFAFDFSVPPGFTAQTDTFFTIRSFYSSVMDFGSSSINIYLNNKLASTFAFPEDNNFLEKQVTLPSYAVRSGVNTIQIETELNSKRYCNSFNQATPWVTILNDSFLNLNLLPDSSEDPSQSAMTEFNAFPEAISTLASLANIQWIIPENDLKALLTAAHLASELGAQSYVQDLKMQVHFASDTLNLSEFSDFDWIIIGESQQLNPIIPAINQFLPVGFLSDKTFMNEAVIFPNSVINRQQTRGYLECVINSANPERAILLITGSNQDGFIAAGNAFLPANRKNLSGNFASISDDLIQSESFDTIISTASVAAEITSQAIASPAEDLNLATQQPDPGEEIKFLGLNTSDPSALALFGVVGFNILFLIFLIIFLIRKLIKGH